MGREKPDREEKEEEERLGRKVGLGLNAGSSAQVTTAPSLVPITLALSPLAGHRPCLGARRQHQWRRAKGPFPEFFPPGVYL